MYNQVEYYEGYSPCFNSFDKREETTNVREIKALLSVQNDAVSEILNERQKYMGSCKECYHYEVCRMHYQQKCELTYETEKEVRRAMLEAEKGSPICDHFKDRSRFVELSHAEWVEDEDMYGDPIYRCSNCNEHFVLEEGTPTDNCYSYCPNCGAKMDEQALKERET